MFQVMSFVRRFAALSGCILTMSVCQPCLSPAQNVLMQHVDNNRDGTNSSETVLTPANVNVSQFGMLFKLAVDDQVYAQPLVDNSVSIAGGTHSVVYVATTNNSVYAFDATSGAQYWHVNLGTAFTIGDGGFTCQDILDTAGIMSTPVIDTANNTLYVVAKTYNNGAATHKLHALNLSTGAEQSGSPVTISAANFISVLENQRPGLLLANGNVYFSFAGHCDQQTWKGITFAYNAGTLAQVGVFDASPDDNGAGIWMSGNGPAVDANGDVYFVTGNGTWDGSSDFSETILKTNASLSLLDWHTPSDYSSLDAGDLDLTSSGPLIVFGTNLLVAGGKDGVLHLVNMGDMGHLGDANAVQNWQAGVSHIHSMDYFNTNLYIWGQSDYLKVYHFNGSTFNTTPAYTGSIQAIGHPGASLSVSSNGNSNPILWAATNSAGQGGGLGAWHMTEPGILYAYSLPGMTQIWTNQQNATRDSCKNYAKFTDPTISNGKVYLASFGTAQTQSGQVCVYGELSGNTCTPTSITPEMNVGGTWTQESSATVTSTSSVVDLGPQPLTGGSWSWTGPNGFTSTAREIDSIPLSTGTNVYTATYTNSCGSKSTQAFTITVTGGSTTLIPNGTYIVAAVNSGLAIDDPDFSKTDGLDMQIYTVNDGTNQQWTINNVSSNVITLANVSSGQFLDVSGASKSSGALVDQWPANGQTNQEWNVISLGGGNFELTSVNSGLALSVVGGGTTNGTDVDQLTYSGSTSQQWKFQAP
jgi:outer membrane protein assembly factor BamB